MTPRNLPWSEGKWRTPPHSTQELNGHLLVEAAIGSDYWEKTSYGFQCTETRWAHAGLTRIRTWTCMAIRRYPSPNQDIDADGHLGFVHGRDQRNDLMGNLTGKRAFLTGASQGIGAAIGEGLIDAGADVCLHYFQNDATPRALAEKATARGQRALVLQADLR
ncbi:MAG TPA: SDR family NAD(P)-dependent oxidoreductase, partial [Polyangiaceae bacterium]|nr:SDR family NAD(P)-dependent oxidoreductase [Polyangiaceae bacterium]